MEMDFEAPESGYDFYGKIDVLVDGLDLPQPVFEASCRVCDRITGLDDFESRVTVYGGVDVVVAASVFLGARQEGVPVSGEELYGFIVSSPVLSVSRNFDGKKVRRLARVFVRCFDEDFSPVFLGVGDYVDYYIGSFDFGGEGVMQKRLAEEMFVSASAVRKAYKLVVEEFTGADVSGKALPDVAVTGESFGYFGDSVEGFVRHLVGLVEEADFSVGRSPRVLAAAVMYVAGKVI